MDTCTWMLIYPSIALSLTLFSLNFLGDGLRDALDPRIAKDQPPQRVASTEGLLLETLATTC